MITKKLSKVAEAYAFAKPMRDALYEHGRCMEITEDKCGIVWQRWIVGKKTVIAFFTPHYAETFVPIKAGTSAQELIDAIAELAKEKVETGS